MQTGYDGCTDGASPIHIAEPMVVADIAAFAEGPGPDQKRIGLFRGYFRKNQRPGPANGSVTSDRNHHFLNALLFPARRLVARSA